MDVNKQNTPISYINVNKQNTPISYINVNKTKYDDILHKCKQNKIRRYPTEM